MRPHPALGTLEMRVLDAQSSLEDVRGLVALVHCLTYHEALTADPHHPSKELLDEAPYPEAPTPPPHPPSKERLDEAAYPAVRDGLDARFSVGGPVQHVQGLARH